MSCYNPLNIINKLIAEQYVRRYTVLLWIVVHVLKEFIIFSLVLKSQFRVDHGAFIGYLQPTQPPASYCCVSNSWHLQRGNHHLVVHWYECWSDGLYFINRKRVTSQIHAWGQWANTKRRLEEQKNVTGGVKSHWGLIEQKCIKECKLLFLLLFIIQDVVPRSCWLQLDRASSLECYLLMISFYRALQSGFL